MANQTAFFLAITITTLFLIRASACDENDQKALLNIKQALGNPTALRSWDPSIDCCTTWQYLDCNNNGRVTKLSIDYSYNLPPLPIPPAIGDLSALETLSIIWAPFYGPIPPSFAKLSQLQLLNIFRTSVSSPLPDFRPNKKLIYLFLRFNNFSGPIPHSLTMHESLVLIDLSVNRFIGSIPQGLFQRMGDSDLSLNLANNQLSGKIPKNLGNGNLRTLWVRENNLTGAAEFLSAPQKRTIMVDISWNKLEFDFTNVNLPRTISYLDLRHNSIRGGIPKSINEVKDLWSLNLSYNDLCGEIPIGEVTERFIDPIIFNNNTCLCGAPLPPCALPPSASPPSA